MILKNMYFLFEHFFLYATFNSVDSDEMPHYAAFHLGLQCLSKEKVHI